MAKIINYETYKRIYNGIKNYLDRNLLFGSKEEFLLSFSQSFNKIITDRSISLPLKSSCRDLILKGDFELALKRIIIWKYTRKESLILETSMGSKILYPYHINFREIK